MPKRPGAGRKPGVAWAGPAGKRPNSGRKPGTAWAGPRGPRCKSYQRLMDWADQLWNLNLTETKKEALQNLRRCCFSTTSRSFRQSWRRPNTESPTLRAFRRRL